MYHKISLRNCETRGTIVTAVSPASEAPPPIVRLLSELRRLSNPQEWLMQSTLTLSLVPGGQSYSDLVQHWSIEKKSQ